MINTLIVLTF